MNDRRKEGKKEDEASEVHEEKGKGRNTRWRRSKRWVSAVTGKGIN